MMKTAYYMIAALALAAAGAAIGAEAPQAATAAASTTTTTAAAVTATQAAPAQPHALTRAEVRAQVIAARQNGTLIETEADMDVAQTRKQIAR
jgi:hypothetical protein